MSRLLLPLVLLASLAVPAEESDPSAQPSAGGRLAWVTSDELELLGDVWFDLPLVQLSGGQLFLAMDARTTISDADGFTFLLRDVDYASELGYRRGVAWARGSALGLFLGARGKELVDADGGFMVLYLGASLESRAFRRAVTDPEDAPLQWRIGLGPVIDENQLSADAVVRGVARWTPFRAQRGFGLDLRLDGLVEDGGLDADISAGPSFAWATGAGNALRLFVHYQDSRNPLGIGESVWMAGFRLEEGPDAALTAGAMPRIDGSIALGSGDAGRIGAAWTLRFLSPTFGQAQRLTISLDGNVLTGEAVGELYYLYDAGWERVRGRRVVGAYFYHRSNHLIAEPNARVTHLNVVEGGLETDGWQDVPGPRAGGGWLGVEARVRLGYLLESSFGEDRRWHLRGGIRWSPPWAAKRLAPFVQAEIESGDIEGESIAFGVAPFEDVAIQLEYGRDEQYLATDRNVLMLSVRYGF